jgi:putative heme-binding domain-containing protein
VERFRPAVRLNGIAANGRRIFAAQCARCHRLGAEGQDIGPDLADARNQGKPWLLASILQPNLEIRPDFQTQLVQTQGGENMVGLVTDENPTTITLRRPGELDLVWPRSNIEVGEPQPWSLMPTGLENGLGLQQMADLLEYIATAQR